MIQMSKLSNNTDFLNENNSNEPIVDSPKKKRRTALEIEMDEYPEYYKLDISQRKSLVATNYFRVLYKEPITEVPISDEHYHKYFDKRCYERVDEYQKSKKSEIEYNEMISRHRAETSPKIEQLKEVVEEIKVKNIEVPEVKPEVDDTMFKEALKKHHQTKKIDDKKKDKGTKKNNNDELGLF